MRAAPPPPSIFGYEDFRRFLKDRFAAEKRANPAFSYGVLAQRAGIPSRSHLKLVINGKRNLTPDYLKRYAKGFRLAPEEMECLHHLVEWNQARDPAAREAARKAHRIWLMNRGGWWADGAERDEFMASWANYLVLGLSRVKGFRANPAWIRRRLEGRISTAEARAALRFLQEKGHLRFKGKRLVETSSGKLQFTDRGGSPMDLTRLKQYVLTEALQAVRSSPERFAWMAGTVVLTAEELKSLVALVREGIPRILPLARKNAEGELIVFTMSAFPVSRA